jgi:hypothetical protein
MAIREYYYFVGHLVCGGLLHCGEARDMVAVKLKG